MRRAAQLRPTWHWPTTRSSVKGLFKDTVGLTPCHVAGAISLWASHSQGAQLARSQTRSTEPRIHAPRARMHVARCPKHPKCNCG
eukprot:6937261-Alexandrium_andersonii.AAC.1